VKSRRKRYLSPGGTNSLSAPGTRQRPDRSAIVARKPPESRARAESWGQGSARRDTLCGARLQGGIEFMGAIPRHWGVLVCLQLWCRGTDARYPGDTQGVRVCTALLHPTWFAGPAPSPVHQVFPRGVNSHRLREGLERRTDGLRCSCWPRTFLSPCVATSWPNAPQRRGGCGGPAF
jgi:hypothetical protein